MLSGCLLFNTSIDKIILQSCDAIALVTTQKKNNITTIYQKLISPSLCDCLHQKSTPSSKARPNQNELITDFQTPTNALKMNQKQRIEFYFKLMLYIIVGVVIGTMISYAFLYLVTKVRVYKQLLALWLGFDSYLWNAMI